MYLNKGAGFAYQPAGDNQTHNMSVVRWGHGAALWEAGRPVLLRANPIVLINSNRFIDPTSDGWIHSRSSEETEIIDLGFSYLEHLQCLCEGGEHCRELYLYHWASSETLKGINAEQKLYFLLFLTVNMSVYSVQRLCVISAVEMSDTSSSPACTAHTERQQVDLSV